MREHTRLTGIAAALALFALAAACRGTPQRNGNGGEEHYTVYELQNFAEARHPAVGSVVHLESVVVTAIDSYDEDGEGHVGSVWIADVDDTGARVCGPWCGVTIYKPDVGGGGGALRMGDIVDVVGTYTEFEYGDDGSVPDPGNPGPYHNEHLSEITDATVTKTGEWIEVLPYEVETGWVKSDPRTQAEKDTVEQFEGVLVTVRNLQAKEEYDKYGQFETQQGVMVEDDLYHFPCAGYTGQIAGTRLDSVTGVVSWFGIKGQFGNYKIFPRGPGDIQPPPSFEGCP